jgi:hypothetical protein
MNLSEWASLIIIVVALGGTALAFGIIAPAIRRYPRLKDYKK